MFDFKHLGDGVTKGMGYIARIGRITEKAGAAGDKAVVDACLHCLGTFADEVLDTTGAVKGNLAAAMFAGDPMSGSRHEAQTIISTYGPKYGVK